MKLQSLVLVIVLIANIISITNAARILAVFPTPAISHQVAFRPLTHELARRGHNVTVITPDPAFPKGHAPANLTEIDVHFSYNFFPRIFDMHQGDKGGLIRKIQEYVKSLTKIFEKQLQVPESKKLFNQKFDLIIVEAHIRPALGLGHVFNAPVIQFSSLGAGPNNYKMFGAPSHPFLYPSPAAQRLYDLTLFEKAEELLKNSFIDYIVSTAKEFEYQMMKRTFGNDVPNYQELEKNVQLLFLNEHPIWADNHPVPTNIVYIGGIHQSPKRELPQLLMTNTCALNKCNGIKKSNKNFPQVIFFLFQEFKTILDSSKNGAIYVSFGSNVKPSLLPPEKLAVMTNVLSKLPYDVLWKWDGEELPVKASNIKFYKWFPQVDLLKHPSVKLFITQGGIQSADETINAAVPVIGIPMIGDQWYNVQKYVKHGVGLQIDLSELTEATFENAVRRVIEDKSFKSNMIRLRSLMREHPVPPLELAVWWVEHTLRHGGQHLRSPAAGLTWTEYYEVPLVLTVLAIVLSIFLVIVLLVLYVVRIVRKYVSSKSYIRNKQKVN
ncbi:UDP-glucosyltransferase 2-like [Colias croceus]|uniref:UDP-glucosyltransferase 2-like n=1 Tax=Colias crocea TaxID=72248 RepID=UPI001E27CDDC|nr:UDP-glucosyltransferase 2-like [Colias croceus]